MFVTLMYVAIKSAVFMVESLIYTPRPDVFLRDNSLFDWICCSYMLLVAGSYDVIKYKSILLCRPICTGI
jgi:hypothetical protein